MYRLDFPARRVFRHAGMDVSKYPFFDFAEDLDDRSNAPWVLLFLSWKIYLLFRTNIALV
jgi:hypothetical protein